jgi:hypothetical protein
MSLSAQLNATTVLTPKEREHNKSAQQKAEDVIYTLNHALTCLSITDFVIAPAIGWMTQEWFGKRVDICGHDHSHDTVPTASAPASALAPAPTPQPPAKPTGGLFGGGGDGSGNPKYKHFCAEPNCSDPAHAQPNKAAATHAPAAAFAATAAPQTTALKRASNWFIGEALGDVGAVLVTIPVQRYFPGFMSGLRHAMEPLVGGLFKKGAERASHKWADKHGLRHDSQEVVDRAQTLYEYELSHLPQMAVWTAASVGINYGVMRTLDHSLTLGTFTKGKAIGSAVTAALVFGTRAIAPDKAHKWDETAGKHVIVPLTKKVGKIFGVEERDVDDYHARRSEDAARNWVEKVNDQPQAQAVRG